EQYKTYRLNVGEIKEIWRVMVRISNFSHQSPDPSSGTTFQDLNETIKEQSALIKRLNYTIEQLVVKA
ncbi:MAG: hypothetical protein OEQ53_20195, partial [Saprospiraceae bacterium]|nr:hypothetical protein [Saprospiraceae bacterium]